MRHTCCVRNCGNRNIGGKRFHRFPKDEKRCNLWLSIIKDNATWPEGLSPQNIIRSYALCDDHFSAAQKFAATSKNRTNLKADAYPDVITNDFNHEQAVQEMTNVDSDILSSISPNDFNHEQAVQEMRNVDSDILSSISPNDFNDEQAVQEMRNVDSDILSSISPNDFNHEQAVQEMTNVDSDILSSRSPNSKSRKKNIMKLDILGVNRVAKLSVTSQHLFRANKKLALLVNRLNNQKTAIKKRLKSAQKAMDSGEFLENKMNSTTYKFLLSQLKLQKRSRYGRRYSLDDKLFALSLMRQSPKSYKLLQRTFVLPSRKILMEMLNGIPFDVGINEAVIRSLKDSVQKMPPSDRICCLLFDEMSLEPSLAYNEKYDRIYGFQNIGDGQPKLKFADHAMVFMARGIKRRWKQPISFYFVESGMTSANIAKNVKIIISKLQSIGLNVVATICDQSTTNVAAINSLKKETRTSYLRTKTIDEFRSCGFEVNGKNVVPLYNTSYNKRPRRRFCDVTGGGRKLHCFKWENGGFFIFNSMRRVFFIIFGSDLM